MESETKKVFDDGEIQLFQGPAPRTFWHYAAAWLAPVGIFAALWLAMLGILLFFTGCGLVQREAPINDKQGKPFYVHEVSGKATTEPTDAAGNARERATVPVSTGNVEQAVDIGKGLAGSLPPPAGLIAEILGSGVLAGTAMALRSARRKRLEELGLNEELIELAADDDDVAKKVETQGSSEIRKRVADKRARKRRAKAA